MADRSANSRTTHALTFFVLCLSLAAAAAQEKAAPLILGELTAESFPGFAAFAEANEDGEAFGLGIEVAANEGGDGAGELAAYDDGSGLLVIYLTASGGEAGAVQLSAQLSIPDGVQRLGDRFLLEGYFATEYAGLHQGITAILLKPAAEDTVPPLLREVPVDEIAADDADGG